MKTRTDLGNYTITKKHQKVRQKLLLRACLDAIPEAIPTHDGRARAALIIGLRWGAEWTLDEVADVLDITRERVRQIENRVLKVAVP